MEQFRAHLNEHNFTTWQELGFELVLTEDQSPTVRWLSHPRTETMHHPGGALAETLLIYGEIIRKASNLGARHFLSVGLGLGYNELVTWKIRQDLGLTDFIMTSYESDIRFVRTFLSSLSNQAANNEIQQTYEKIQELIGIKQSDKIALMDFFHSSNWIFGETLNGDSSQVGNLADVIMFDAYSSKTSPELWTEDFFAGFFENCCAKSCLFSTFACTGNLKRSLKKAGFQMLTREGFLGKRESILAFRGQQFETLQTEYTAQKLNTL